MLHQYNTQRADGHLAVENGKKIHINKKLENNYKILIPEKYRKNLDYANNNKPIVDNFFR